MTFDLKDFAHLDHGYAATIHKAQGNTVDRAHILATPGLDRHAAYVAASILGTDEETTGMRLIKTAAPGRWRDIVAGYQISRDNRAAIAQCERSEARTTPGIHCAIEIRNANSR